MANSLDSQPATELANCSVRMDVVETTILDIFIRGYFPLFFLYQANIFANTKAMRKGFLHQIYANLFTKI
jgi:hypothetical protein